MSRRMLRKRIGLSIASVAERKRRLKRSARSSSSFDSSSATLSSFISLAFIASDLLAAHEARLHGELRGGEGHRLLGERLLDAFDLEHHAPGLHDGDPPLRIPLALAHARLGRLFRDRLVREDPDPHLAATLHLARHRDAARLDLPVRDPAGLQAHQPVLAERHGIAPRRDALGASLERLAKLDPLRCQHRSRPRRVGAPGHVLDDLTLEDPDLDPDRPERRLRRARGVVDLGAKGVKRHPALAISFGPRDFGAAQAARRTDLDALRTHPHGALHRALHGAAEGDALLQLVRDVVGDELGRELRPLDLLDVDRRLLAGELRELVAQLVHLRAALPDHHAGPPGMDGDGDLPRPPVDVHLGDRRVAETGLQVLPDQLVLLEQRRHVLRGEPPRLPRLHDAEAEADRMRLLAHQLFSLAATWISTWLVRLRIGVPRPCAAAWNRLSGVPPFTIALVTMSVSTSNDSFSFIAFCSAFATAERSVFSICFAASFLLNLSSA